MAKTYNDFYTSVIGKRYDIDGYYGAQCWDGYAEYCKFLGIPYAHCTQSGYVKDIWTLRKSNGILKHCKEVSVMAPGDIVVFKEAPATPLSHIAIFHRDAGGGCGYFLGQNQGGSGGAFNLCKIPYSATYPTAFRPNVLAQNAPKPEAPTKGWTQKAVLKVGDTVRSVSCSIAPWPGTGNAIKGNLVYVPALGGGVPLSDVSESDDTGDGKKDDYLANSKARVWLNDCKVTKILGPDLVQLDKGYVVKAGPLMALR